MKSVYVFVSLVALCAAQVPSFGWCPEYLPMPDFEMERFLGKWYEAERYFQFSEVATRCVVTDYARSASGKIYVSNEVTNRLTGVKRIIGGHLDLVGKSGEGKMKIRYQTTPINTEQTVTVLDTDYDNYAVLWSCSGFGPVHTQNAWVMTRERLAPGTILQRAYGVLDKYKISRTFFLRTDQEGCALAASDINAANGITLESTVPEVTGNDQRYQTEVVERAVPHKEIKNHKENVEKHNEKVNSKEKIAGKHEQKHSHHLEKHAPHEKKHQVEKHSHEKHIDHVDEHVAHETPAVPNADKPDEKSEEKIHLNVKSSEVRKKLEGEKKKEQLVEEKIKEKKENLKVTDDKKDVEKKSEKKN